MFDDKTLRAAFYHTYGLVLGRYDVTGNSLLQLDPDIPNFSPLEDGLAVREKLIGLCSEKNSIVLLSTPYNCVWMGVPCGQQVYLLGPAFLNGISKKDFISNTMKQANENRKKLEYQELDAAYNQIPIITFQALQTYTQMLAELIDSDARHRDGILIANTFPDVIMPKQNESDIYHIQTRDFASALRAEQFIQYCISNGDVERVQHLPHSVSETSYGNIGENELRKTKNAGIVLISLSTRSALSGGLPVEIAFPLSDAYILQIEKMTDVAAINTLLRDAIYDFTQRVRACKNQPQYSAVVSRCIGYIIANINRPIKLKDVARSVEMNSETISRRFVKETGTSIPHYIAAKKIEEAKLLLTFTTKPAVEIAYLLAFSSQSQFTVTFKKETGFTPLEYRQSL